MSRRSEILNGVGMAAFLGASVIGSFIGASSLDTNRSPEPKPEPVPEFYKTGSDKYFYDRDQKLIGTLSAGSCFEAVSMTEKADGTFLNIIATVEGKEMLGQVGKTGVTRLSASTLRADCAAAFMPINATQHAYTVKTDTPLLLGAADRPAGSSLKAGSCVANLSPDTVKEENGLLRVLVSTRTNQNSFHVAMANLELQPNHDWNGICQVELINASPDFRL